MYVSIGYRQGPNNQNIRLEINLDLTSETFYYTGIRLCQSTMKTLHLNGLLNLLQQKASGQEDLYTQTLACFCFVSFRRLKLIFKQHT